MDLVESLNLFIGTTLSNLANKKEEEDKIEYLERAIEIYFESALNKKYKVGPSFKIKKNTNKMWILRPQNLLSLLLINGISEIPKICLENNFGSITIEGVKFMFTTREGEPFIGINPTQTTQKDYILEKIIYGLKND